MIRSHPRPIRGVIFDLDGTITVPVLDFAAIRADIETELGPALFEGRPILERLDALPDAERRRGYDILERHEAEGAGRSTLNDGAAELLAFLRETGIKTAIVTRNSRGSAETVARKHGLAFDAIITRDDAPPKPSPEPLLLAARQIGLSTDEVIYVGDFEMDRLAGAAAGIPTYIVKVYPEPRDNGSPEMRVDSLADLINVVRSANEL